MVLCGGRGEAFPPAALVVNVDTLEVVAGEGGDVEVHDVRL